MVKLFKAHEAHSVTQAVHLHVDPFRRLVVCSDVCDVTD